MKRLHRNIKDKHIVGSSYTFNDTGWNEFSQRWSDVPMEFYIPEDAPETYKKSIEASKVAYNAALEAGMPREQARGILPLSIYTEFVWTASLQAVVHFCKLRKHTGAQKEIQQYAEAVEFLCRPQAPISWDALMSSEGV